ncbi:MAG TPA: sensor histidine kinase, partial [Xylanibacter oryzae]|nr:sensor histidine kinase [Xylanibacter oryzae]
HGISPTKPSFINITISTDGKMLVCYIKNSNFPKESADCSGHGIGLKQVEKRLELSYHENYEWTKRIIDNNTKYESKIIIYDTKLCNS